MTRIVGKLTYANLMATANSVGTKQIKNNAITGAKIKLASLGQVSSAATAARAVAADSALALAAPEPVHLITEFEHGFRNSGEGLEEAGYYLDRQCEVHLQGSILGNSGLTAFVLPEGFRPSGDLFASIPTGTGPGYLELLANGSARVGLYGSSGERTFGLDGLTFRVARC